jgi:hypothetical protein
MGKNKKKKDKKHKNGPAGDLEAEVQRLRSENENLRARLVKIADLASDLPGDPDEDDEYDELTRDVDDEIADSGVEPGQQEPDVNPS